MYCATVLYPSKEGSSFDFDHYTGTLAPMYAQFLGKNCVRFEGSKGIDDAGQTKTCVHLHRELLGELPGRV